MAIIKEADFSDFLTHMLDCGVYYDSSTNTTHYGFEWGFFISPDNTRTQQILITRELITKAEMDFNCSMLRIPKMKFVY